MGVFSVPRNQALFSSGFLSRFFQGGFRPRRISLAMMQTEKYRLISPLPNFPSTHLLFFSAKKKRNKPSLIEDIYLHSQESLAMNNV